MVSTGGIIFGFILVALIITYVIGSIIQQDLSWGFATNPIWPWSSSPGTPPGPPPPPPAPPGVSKQVCNTGDVCSYKCSSKVTKCSSSTNKLDCNKSYYEDPTKGLLKCSWNGTVCNETPAIKCIDQAQGDTCSEATSDTPPFIKTGSDKCSCGTSASCVQVDTKNNVIYCGKDNEGSPIKSNCVPSTILSKQFNAWLGFRKCQGKGQTALTVNSKALNQANYNGGGECTSNKAIATCGGNKIYVCNTGGNTTPGFQSNASWGALVYPGFMDTSAVTDYPGYFTLKNISEYKTNQAKDHTPIYDSLNSILKTDKPINYCGPAGNNDKPVWASLNECTSKLPLLPLNSGTACSATKSCCGITKPPSSGICPGSTLINPFMPQFGKYMPSDNRCVANLTCSAKDPKGPDVDLTCPCGQKCVAGEFDGVGGWKCVPP